MKKSLTILFLVFITVNCLAENELNDFFKRKKKPFLSEMIQNDISLLKLKGCSQFVTFNNDPYFLDRKQLKPVSIYDWRYYFLMYKYNGLDYIIIYYLTGHTKEGYEIYSEKVFEGFDATKLWTFYDTCNVLEPFCDSIIISDGNNSNICFYNDTILKEYFMSARLHQACPDSPYVVFMNLVSEEIKNFLFVNNRFKIKDILKYKKRLIELRKRYSIQ